MHRFFFLAGSLLALFFVFVVFDGCAPTPGQEAPREEPTAKESAREPAPGEESPQESPREKTPPPEPPAEESVAMDGGEGEPSLPEEPVGEPVVEKDPWKPPFSPAVCGVKEYQWLSPAKMGRLVNKEKMPAYSLTKAALTMLLNATRYKGMLQIKYGVTVYRFRYETQDKGKKQEATAVMALPQLAQGKTLKTPYVLWLHGTSGFMDDCAPSRNKDGPLSVALVASQGYIAVAPDYLGMNGMGKPSTMPHPYLVGEATALASLDSLRAADRLLQEESSPVTPDGRFVAWGGSQGGHATLFSLLYAPYYTPEYKLVAGVALVAPTDLIAQAEAAILTLGDATITLAAGFVAMSRWYGHEDKLTEVLTNKEPYFIARELGKLMDSGCKIDDKKYKFTKTTDIITPALYKAIKEQKNWKGFSRWRCMIAENSLTATSVKRKNDPPVLYVVSGKDGLVNPQIQHKSFVTLCQQGYRMNYLECKGAGHTDGAVWSLPNQFAWVAKRLAGDPLQDVCKQPPPLCCPGSDPKICKP